ncbi:zinc-dependent alcohol dehydrogenase family protein [Amycolatopsis ultiminotia]|uniref:Zinc-dependent alcohol dehydrogenase family protein n=1 Tax=Amycolatopsis ultiminotia TaxID=543629 RepID=A0ABP6WA55_9PSEU
MVVTESGGLAEAEAPEPVPGPGQVRVAVEAIGVGYVDVMAARGDYAYFPGPGSPLGLEVAGRVSATGPDVPGGLAGQRVLALPEFGGFAEQVVVPVERVLPSPDNAAVEVVALGLNALVAEIALHRSGLAAGDHVLVRGAGGGIGVLATQIAAAHGAEVTAVTSSPARGERLRALGAARIADRTVSPLPDGTYDVVLDTVAGADLGRHLALLRPNGRYVLCGGAGGDPGPDAFASLLREFHRSPTFTSFSLNSVPGEELRLSWKRIAELVRETRLVPVLDERFPLGAAAAALAAVAGGKVFGKVLLMP